MLRILIVLLSLIIIPFSLTQNVYSQTEKKDGEEKYTKWKFLYEEKCSKCHTLERVFANPKTEKEWRLCITRMMRKNPLWITADDSDIIANEIIHTKHTHITPFSKRRYNNAKMLFIDRCTKCHSLNRILSKNKSKTEWLETVTRMRDNAPDLFNNKDVVMIVDYLSENSKLMRDDMAAKIMVNKCLVCHEWGRILLARKTREEWEECVNDMRKIARKSMKKDWFTFHEFNIIVGMLVKTQGMD